MAAKATEAAMGAVAAAVVVAAEAVAVGDTVAGAKVVRLGRREAEARVWVVARLEEAGGVVMEEAGWQEAGRDSRRTAGR